MKKVLVLILSILFSGFIFFLMFVFKIEISVKILLSTIYCLFFIMIFIGNVNFLKDFIRENIRCLKK